MTNLSTLPDLTPGIRSELGKVLGGAPHDQFAANVRTHAFWHRRDVPVVVKGEDILFFNETQSTFGSNWKGSLPSGEAFVLQALRIDVRGGYQVDGTAEANSEPYDDNGGNAAGAAADIAAMINDGVVSMRVNDREIVQNVFGLYNFPKGGGPVVGGAGLATTATTTTTSAAHVNNGEAHNGNAWLIQPQPGGLVIAPKEDIDLRIKFSFARTLTDALVISAQMFGLYVTPAKR